MILYTAFAVLLLAACNSGNQDTKTSMSTPPSEATAAVSDTGGFHGDINLQGARNLSYKDPDWDRKIIRHGTMTIEVANFEKYNRWLRNTLKEFGAYISEEEQQDNDYRKETRLTIRVPANSFEDLVSKLPCDSTVLKDKKINSEDVSSEYIDIAARAEAKKQTLNRYLSFLRESKNMKEALEVQREINSIQEQIESAGGRMQYLAHKAAYSTLELTCYQLSGGAIPEKDTGFFSKLIQALQNGLSNIGNLVVVLAGIWPVLVITGIAWRFIRKKKGIAHTGTNT